MKPAGIDAARRDSATRLFEELESNVRSYCRGVPLVFTTAEGPYIRSEDGQEILDFFSGAGALNYGHNDPKMVSAMIAHLQAGGVLHGLDFYTVHKRALMQAFEEHLLKPRGWDFKIQFCGPTGADANEAALKLARKITGRSGVVAFNGGYHGMTRGALAVSGAKDLRAVDGSSNFDVTFVPYENSSYGPFDSIGYLERLADDAGSGFELPAAVIVEAIQIQAGVYRASTEWLKQLRKWTSEHGVILICDEVQSGCGRSGSFFAFETSQIVPDIITCAKSISGSGLPMAVLFMRRELDHWQPGEHTGTFRGNQLAFVTASIALQYWSQADFRDRLRENVDAIKEFARDVEGLDLPVTCRAYGLIAGIDFGQSGSEEAAKAQSEALGAGVLVERCGPRHEVVKLMPPINCEAESLLEGLHRVKRVLTDVF